MSKVGKGVQACVSWIPFNGYLPDNAICAGDDVYVARSWHENDLIPGKFPHSHGCCYVPYGGAEHSKEHCEILVDTGLHFYGDEYKWKSDSNGDCPKRAFIAGFSNTDGEPHCVARSTINGETVVGKVHPSHGCAYFPYGGEEHRSEEYEVLVMCKN